MKLWVILCLLGCDFVVGSLRAETPRTAAASVAASARDFWSFRSVTRPPVPAVPDPPFPIRNPIDAFIVAKLREKGLSPARPASRRDLIRRVTLDLTGLPPRPEEVEAFERDSATDTFQKRIEDTLASPHFGERWAQHWLDVVRYAESEGFEYDRHLPDGWRYRDYVIDAMREDKPFDQFVYEQVAGDEMGSQSQDGPRAAILHRLGPVRRNAGNPEIALSRNEVLTERTDIIGAAFLGLTLGCARCHDHKLDPIPQKDYYRLQAYLAGTQENDVVLVSGEARKAWDEATHAVQDSLKKLRKALEKAEGDERLRLTGEIERLENSLPAPLPTLPTIREDAAQRTAIHVLKRGEWEHKGERVAPRPLSVLVDDDVAALPADAPEPKTELARWLTSPSNPLTARVIVNRLWQHHFGSGLVRTPNDFGHSGDRPSHPELLDWLASELVDQGWRLKAIHRLILDSSTYQQASVPDSEVAQRGKRIDPENRLLWHFPQRRLSAEEIRDSMLAVSGRLNPAVGGPSIMVPVDPELVQLLYKPAQWSVTRDPGEQNRRSIYLMAKRNLRLPFMETFDQPGLLVSCGRRESSTHAPQALELLNGRLSNELARAFADRLEKDNAGDPGGCVEQAFRLALGRAPNSREKELARAFVAESPLSEFTLALFNLNEFLYVP